MKPVVFTLTIFFIGFPLLGKILVSFLKYEQFVTTEFLFAKAEFYKTGKGENISFSEYKRVFKEKEEEARRKESLRKEKLKRKHIGGHLKNSLEMQEELIIDSLMEGKWSV